MIGETVGGSIIDFINFNLSVPVYQVASGADSATSFVLNTGKKDVVSFTKLNMTVGSEKAPAYVTGSEISSFGSQLTTTTFSLISSIVTTYITFSGGSFSTTGSFVAQANNGTIIM